jgi:hypothetical protein
MQKGEGLYLYLFCDVCPLPYNNIKQKWLKKDQKIKKDKRKDKIKKRSKENKRKKKDMINHFLYFYQYFLAHFH